MKTEGSKIGKPMARYLDLITSGLRSVGCDERMVQEMAVPVTPRPTALSSFSFVDGTSDTKISIDEVRASTNSSNPCCICNGKVLRHPCPELVEGTLWMKRMRESYAGKDITLALARVYCEPQLGPVYDSLDFTITHGAFVEDILCKGILNGWKAIGTVKHEGNKGKRKVSDPSNIGIFIFGGHNETSGALSLISRQRCEKALSIYRQVRGKCQ